MTGAGASVPYIPNSSVSDITNSITEYNQNWNEVLNNVCVNSKIFETTIEDNYFSKLKKLNSKRFLQFKIELRELLAMLRLYSETLEDRNHYPDFGRFRFNFELILTLIDELGEFVKMHAGGNYTDHLNTLGGLFTKFVNKNFFSTRNSLKNFNASLRSFMNKLDTSGWRHLPFLFREVIISHIRKAWEQSQKKDQGIQSFSNFINSIRQSENSLNMFTLNYDPILLEATRKFSQVKSGFKISETPEKRKHTFNPGEYLNAENSVGYLHGFIGFVPSDPEHQRNSSSVKLKISLDENYLRSPVSKYETSTLTRTTDEGTPDLNKYIVTGFQKLNAFNVNPFSAYHQKFVECIQRCNRFIIIGYSFGQTHIENFFKNFWTAESSDKQVLIVDYRDKESGQARLFVDRVKRSFDLKTNQTRNDNHNWTKIGNKIYFYWNGTEEFLENYGDKISEQSFMDLYEKDL